MMVAGYRVEAEDPGFVRRYSPQPVDIFSWVQFTDKTIKQASICICTHKLTGILGLLLSIQFRHINQMRPLCVY